MIKVLITYFQVYTQVSTFRSFMLKKGLNSNTRPIHKNVFFFLEYISSVLAEACNVMNTIKTDHVKNIEIIILQYFSVRR